MLHKSLVDYLLTLHLNNASPGSNACLRLTNRYQ